MKVNYAFVENMSQAPQVSLKAVWLVEADNSYDVKKKEPDRNEIVALWTMSGSGTVILENQQALEVCPDTLIFFMHQKVRRYSTNGERWVFRWFEFKPGPGFSVPLNAIYRIVDSDEERDLCTHCLNLLRLPAKSSRTEASAAFSLLVSKWLAQFEAGRNTSPYQALIEKIILHMRMNISKQFPVAQMAEMAGLCSRRFHDVFVEATGYTPKKYFDVLRLKCAEELLKNTSLSIAEVSEKTGFSSQFHFSSAFRKVCGVPPSKYRKY